MAVHPKALQGYDSASDAYQRGRPEYPAELIAWMHAELVLPPQSAVLELGAGTGKFTQTLTGAQFDITALEPVPAMRDAFHTRYPAITLLDGVAEHIPCAEHSFDAVVAAQAFHWFDGPAVLRECARVLKPSGVLLLLWNMRDDRVDWIRAYDGLIDAHAGDTPRYKHGQWQQAFATRAAFTPLQHTRFAHTQSVTKAQLLDRALSTSFIAALPEDARLEFTQRMHALLETHPELQGNGTVPLPYYTDVYWCRKR